jgi:acyl-CoA carboxylase epsilon subunit-like protein
MDVRIVRGNPDEIEVAALLAALEAVIGQDPAPPADVPGE